MDYYNFPSPHSSGSKKLQTKGWQWPYALKALENPSVLLLACGGGRGFQVLLRFPCITCCLPSLSQGHPASSEDTSSMKLWAQPAPVWHHLDQPMPYAGTLLANKVLGVKTSSRLWGFPFNVLKTIVSPIRSSERSDLFFLPHPCRLWYHHWLSCHGKPSLMARHLMEVWK